MKIKLFKRDGSFIQAFEIPAFGLPPDVLLWGRRLFVLAPLLTVNDPPFVGYVEGTTWALDVPDISEARRAAWTLPEAGRE